MRMMIAAISTISATLLILPANGNGQTPQKGPTFTIAGHTGEAQLLQVNGKSYIEIQTLARLTQGTLSFKADQTILTLSLSMRKQAAFISPDTFHSSPLEDQILSCARNFVSMTESHAFQDQPSCH